MQKSSAFILGASFIIAIVAGVTLDKNYGRASYYNEYSSLAVQGNAKARLEAQSVSWSIAVSRGGQTVAGAYRAIEKDSSAIKAFFLGNGLSESDFTFSPILTVSSYNQEAITASRNVTISTDKIDAAEKVFKSLSKLAENGISLTAAQGYDSRGGAPMYSFDNAKIAAQGELLVKAFENANEQAQMLAKKSGIRITGINAVYPYYADDLRENQHLERTLIFTVGVNVDFRAKQ
ncbi:MAG: SIMPL domain-containing protein [Helicobacteraceae bacterium]|jgi:hypothetical protein|nr:SIMPL domain-containing protein [Helicobacteraceae bacterium]